LPGRVREGQRRDKTYGYVNGALTPLVSGVDGSWTPGILERLTQLQVVGDKLAEFVSTHVEMKVAMMMIERKMRHAEVVINHAPCGIRPDQRAGCDQTIAPFLPAGYVLTVYGTTQEGKPFSKTYKGQA
jgi:hypothetical protein